MRGWSRAFALHLVGAWTMLIRQAGRGACLWEELCATRVRVDLEHDLTKVVSEARSEERESGESPRPESPPRVDGIVRWVVRSQCLALGLSLVGTI